MARRSDHSLTRTAAHLFRLAAQSRWSAGRVVRPLFAAMPSVRAPARPVFVIGCPRSGTSLLFQALALTSELVSLDWEGHVLWEAFNHPNRRGWSSNALGAEDVTGGERKYIYSVARVLARRRRFLDKTPKNCLRIPYLNELFPDASFVFLRRQAADNVNSLMQGWRARPRYASYELPEVLEGLGDLSGRTWSFVLIPGWRELTRAPLEEICARQYVACNEAILSARTQIESVRMIDVAYENLVARPSEEIERVYEGLRIPFTDEAAAFAAALPQTPINALTLPKPEKWRDENPEGIRRILRLVAETERSLGY